MSDGMPSLQENVVTENGHSDLPKKVIIQLFNNLLGTQVGDNPSLKQLGAPTEWVELIFRESNVFFGYDELMWGSFIACVYCDPQDAQLSCILVDKVGASLFSSIDISKESQYYSAIENLTSACKDNRSRQSLAVTLLQRFAQLSEKDLRRVHPETFKFDYDPTHAGDLASACDQIEEKEKTVEIGRELLSLGFFQDRRINSALLDVIYEYNETVSESNNKLVFHLGQQLEQLFNPLTEYSPEQTEYTYKPPADEQSTEEDDSLVKAISRELLDLQTNFTLNLVEFLQKFVIALRVQVLNGEIDGLSTVKLNRLFPPTIDEVTRINCIFLDSLKSATSFGSLEVLKACSITIPYFYKAYTRHEAATKHFNKDIKLFLRNFSDKIPLSDVFTEMKIDSLIKGPQEKLLKIKLIIDRLYASKKWKLENEGEAKKCYDNVIEVIDSFGRLEAPLSSYSSRVFTPSGKILMELAKGWPAELQYKWLKRRVVGVFDMIDPNDSTKEKLLVIFSDYLMFLDVTEVHDNYGSIRFNKPSISDILMNSLVNEVPLPSTMPQLRVSNYCYIDEAIVTLFGNNCLRFDAFRGANSFAVTLRVQRKSVSASTIADLVTKAKILEKDTAFHLFKAAHDDITVYSTAHEIETYNDETIKSKFALFLNMPPNKKVIMQHKLHVAMFAKFVPTDSNDEIVQLHILTSDGGLHLLKIDTKELIPTILQQLSFEIPVCFSSIYSPLLPVLFAANESIVKGILSHEAVNDLNSKVANKYNSSNPGKNSEVKSSSGNKASGFHPKHGPAKSYATITTFRSNVSDTKAVDNHHSVDRFDFEETEDPKRIHTEPEEPWKKENKIKHLPDESIPSPPTRQESQPVSNRAGKHQKRRSISNVFKTIFSGKKKSNGNGISVLKDKTKRKISEEKRKGNQKRFFSSDSESKSNGGNKQRQGSFLQDVNTKQTAQGNVPADRKVPTELSTAVESSYPRKKMEEETRHLSLPLEQLNASKDTSQNSRRLSAASDFTRPIRLSSGANNTDSVLYRDSQIPETANKDVGQPAEIGPPELNASRKESAVSAFKISDEKSDSSLAGKTDASQQNINDVNEQGYMMASQDERLNEANPQSAGENNVPEDIGRKASRESQVFNDDLFGDVISDPKRSPSRSIINEVDTPASDKRNPVIATDGLAMPGRKASDSSGINRGEGPTAQIASQGNVPQPERIPHVTEEKDSQLRESNLEKALQKKPINPKVQNLKISRINFERSSSFMELFQGMRLVLDESDAKYNWKRLPSEYSLRDTSPVNFAGEQPVREPQHVFKSIAFAGRNIPINARTGSALRRPSQMEGRTSDDVDSSARKPGMASNRDRDFTQERGRKPHKIIEEGSTNGADLDAVRGNRFSSINQNVSHEYLAPKDEDISRRPQSAIDDNAFVSKGRPTLSVRNGDNMEELEKSDEDISNQLFENSLPRDRGFESLRPTGVTNESSQKRPAKSKIPIFKVVDHSPTRIIQRSSPDRAGSPYNIPSDVSISPDLNKRVNKRLFELKFPSREDMNDSRSSPTRGAVKSSVPDTTTQDVGYMSEPSIPSEPNNEDSNTTPEDSLPAGKPLPRDDGGLLEDLDFSSFNVTFDNFNRDHDASMMSTARVPPPRMTNQDRFSPTVENLRPEEPIIYHLSRSNENSTKKTPLNRPFDTRRNQDDDDPIWISPSKLDYYDINKVTHPTYKDTETMIRTTTGKSMHRMLVENPTSMDELSFAYLASMIDEVDDQPLNGNDKPIRLKFKE